MTADKGLLDFGDWEQNKQLNFEFRSRLQKKLELDTNDDLHEYLNSF